MSEEQPMRPHRSHSFVMHPHEMILDKRISDAAYRAWGAIHFAKWNNDQKADPEMIAEIMGADVRSVRRWFAQLHNAGWITWNRNCPDLRERVIHHTRQSSQEEIILAQLRSKFRNGAPTIDEIRAIINASVSDSDVRSDSDVPTDPRVQTSDSGISSLDARVQTSDSGISGLDASIRSEHDLPLPDAPDRPSPDHGGGGGNHVYRKQIHHHHQRARASVTDVRVHEPTESERWMVSKGASRRKAAQWGHLPIEVVQREWTWRSQAGQGPGAVFQAWEIVAPQLPSAAAPADAAALSVTEATRRVRAIAPADADSDEVRLLVDELLAGATDEQALDHLAFTRAQRAQIERVVGQASPWDRLLGELQARIGRSETAQHFRGARLTVLEEGRAVVAVPTIQAKTAIESRYLTTIAEALREIQGQPAEQVTHVRIVIQPTASM